MRRAALNGQIRGMDVQHYDRKGLALDVRPFLNQTRSKFGKLFNPEVDNNHKYTFEFKYI